MGKRHPYSEYPQWSKRAAKYDWDLWFNGDIWELEPGVDFHVPIPRMQAQAWNAAGRLGKEHLRTWTRDGHLFIQCLDDVPLDAGNYDQLV